MRSDDLRTDLIAEFPELAQPEVVMQKEVFAHFGLTFMAFNSVEHSLIEILTLNTVYEGISAGGIRNRADWEAAFDKARGEAIALTFGNLLKRTAAISEFSDLQAAFMDAKQTRDYFAHHFMREEARFFETEAGCWLLLTKIAEVRKTLESLDEMLMSRFDNMTNRLKIRMPSKHTIEQEISKLLAEAADDLTRGSAKVGWEK